MPPPHPEASAKAPWTRTTVGAEPAAGVPCAMSPPLLMEDPAGSLAARPNNAAAHPDTAPPQGKAHRANDPIGVPARAMALGGVLLSPRLTGIWPASGARQRWRRCESRRANPFQHSVPPSSASGLHVLGDQDAPEHRTHELGGQAVHEDLIPAPAAQHAPLPPPPTLLESRPRVGPPRGVVVLPDAEHHIVQAEGRKGHIQQQPHRFGPVPLASRLRIADQDGEVRHSLAMIHLIQAAGTNGPGGRRLI